MTLVLSTYTDDFLMMASDSLVKFQSASGRWETSEDRKLFLVRGVAAACYGGSTKRVPETMDDLDDGSKASVEHVARLLIESFRTQKDMGLFVGGVSNGGPLLYHICLSSLQQLQPLIGSEFGKGPSVWSGGAAIPEHMRDLKSTTHSQAAKQLLNTLRYMGKEFPDCVGPHYHRLTIRNEGHTWRTYAR